MKFKILIYYFLLVTFAVAQETIFTPETLIANKIKSITIEEVNFFNGTSDTVWSYQEYDSTGKIILGIRPAGIYFKEVWKYNDNLPFSYVLLELKPDTSSADLVTMYKKNILEYNHNEFKDTVGIHQYSYDKNGSLINVVATNFYNWPICQSYQYTYDSLGNLIDVTSVVCKADGDSSTNSVKREKHEYDTRGNLLRLSLFDEDRQTKPYVEFYYRYRHDFVTYCLKVDFRSETEYFYFKNGLVKQSLTYASESEKTKKNVLTITTYKYSKNGLIESVSTIDAKSKDVIFCAHFKYDCY